VDDFCFRFVRHCDCDFLGGVPKSISSDVDIMSTLVNYMGVFLYAPQTNFSLHPIIFRNDCFSLFKIDFQIILSRMFLKHVFLEFMKYISEKHYSEQFLE